MLVNKKYVYVSEKALIYLLLRSKALKCSKIKGYNHTRKTSGYFFMTLMSVDFNSFAKVSVPVETVIPCCVIVQCWSYLTIC